MNKKELVSVLLAAYNGQEYIREAIESVLFQTYENFELIISDDGSTDKTEIICREYAAKDKRIKYIRHDTNRGGFWNNTFLIKKSGGEYISFLSQDDALKKDFLEHTVRYLSRYPNCILISGDFELIDEIGNLIRIEKLTLLRDDISWRKRSCEFFRYRGPQVSMCLYGVYRSKELKEVYPNIKFSRKVTRGSDFFLLSPIATLGEIASIPFIIRKYRLHSTSTSYLEIQKRNASSFFTKRVLLLMSTYRVRWEQMRVLIGSSFSWDHKFYIITSVLCIYIREFSTRFTQFLRKKFF